MIKQTGPPRENINCIFSKFHGPYANLRPAPVLNHYVMLGADQVYHMKMLRSLQETNKFKVVKKEHYIQSHYFRQEAIPTSKTRTNYGKGTFHFQGI